MAEAISTIAQHQVFGGTLGYYKHTAQTTKCDMRFSVFVPPQARSAKRPILWWLSGLTCTEDNFTVKAGAYRMAADLGLVIVAPDTSPRGPGVADSPDYDLGQGAGFYIDATEAPWLEHFKMESYIARELPEVVFASFPADRERQGVSGHSMGGHGALTLALKYPQTYKSISAFAPICAPMQVPWGQKAFSSYLGSDRSKWNAHDATALMNAAGERQAMPPILIDQGEADQFLETQLKPQLFVNACRERGQKCELRRLPGYDHSYFFIQTFIDDHLAHHAKILG
ncbi:MAG: S-formylglutathione hydrolase [Alphaproteobacteria bacterium]